MAKNDYFFAIGRRKSSTAKVKLTSGSGNITINSKPSNEYFKDSKYILNRLNRPFMALDLSNKYNIDILTYGGGPVGQADAITLGIAKCLIQLNPDYKQTLKRASLLKRDPREKERKKFGLLGARKKRQFTKR